MWHLFSYHLRRNDVSSRDTSTTLLNGQLSEILPFLRYKKKERNYIME